jgi:hypothetical protein
MASASSARAAGRSPVVAQVAIEVDPAGGTITPIEGGARKDPGGASLALVPVTHQHVQVTRVECHGCGDAKLDGQWINVRFQVGRFVLEGWTSAAREATTARP